MPPEPVPEEHRAGPKERRARLEERRARLLLGLGAALGLALATAGLMLPALDADDALPADAVARVGRVLIPRDDYERLLAGLDQDTRSPIDAEARRHVLDRMIDEELLVQRALELGLAQADRRVRADLTSALIASIVADAEDAEPTEAELRAFYDESRDLFTQPGRVHVRQVFFRVSGRGQEADARARAEEARARLLRGEPLDAVRDALGDRPVSPIPDAPLPPLKLREYVGPTALRSALELEPGEVSEPVRSGVGIHVLVLVDREEPRVPPFEEIEAQLRSEWRRRAGDRALRAYLDELRDRIEVVTAQEPATGA